MKSMAIADTPSSGLSVFLYFGTLIFNSLLKQLKLGQSH